MKVRKLNLGGGLNRLEIVPSHWSEGVLPEEVADRIISDFIANENGFDNDMEDEPEAQRCWAHEDLDDKYNEHDGIVFDDDDLEHGFNPSLGEPDGVDIHVDRPTSSNFPNYISYIKAKDNYTNLLDAARKCNWECREPMKGMEGMKMNNHKPTCKHKCNNRTPFNNWLDDEDLDDVIGLMMFRLF